MEVEKVVRRAMAMKQWQMLLAGMVVATGMTEVIVSLMSIYFWDHITHDYLITGAVTAGIVSLIVLSVYGHLIALLKKKEDRILQLVSRDVLTDLPNQTVLIEKIGASLARVSRQEGYMFALIALDLDHFKNVRNNLGYTASDRVLVEVARRLQGNVRPYDTVVRMGEDEFAILLEDVKNAGSVARTAERLHSLIREPIMTAGSAVQLTASIGINMVNRVYEKPEDVLHDADIAMNKAKALGRSRSVIYDVTLQEQVNVHLQIENGLRTAIEKGQFILHYQPIVRTETGEIVGFEALLRWKYPEKGMVSPGEFIPIAEESGLIVPIGKWVLQEACRQLHAWHRRFPGKEHLTMSVNVSMKQFTPDLVDTVREVLGETGLRPGGLKLEITESVIMNNPKVSAEVYSRIRDLNIKTSLDDFGTGYSSLCYLHMFSIDTLKIDRSFITSMKDNGSAMEIIRTIIAMAHNMKMDVVAEGVETVEQLEELRGLKCDYYQGFWFSRPLAREEAEKLLEKEVH